VKRKYVAFDLETAKDVPGEDFNWKAHRPLGISCAAIYPADAKEPIVRYGRKANGKPAPRMSAAEALRIVEELLNYQAAGYTVLTWNGLGFDFDVLAEESSDPKACKKLALNHVDMMFHVHCDRGFPVKLDKAAEALGIPGKPAGMSGLLAPKLWAQKRYQDVLDYVAQDVRIALEVALACEKRRQFAWITQKGSRRSFDLPHGWLSVRNALRLPDPDTSWMDSPIPRHGFTRWLGIK
jgi:hypothetical protein